MKKDKYLMNEEELKDCEKATIFDDFDIKKCEQIFLEKTKQSFSDFYTKYYPKLIYKATLFLKGDSDLAEDIIMETVLNALKKIDQYDPTKSNVSTWIFTISKNFLYQEFNKKVNSKVISFDVEMDKEGHTMLDYLADDDSVQEEEINKQDYYEMMEKKSDIIMDCIINLKEPYRQAMTLREIDNLSYEEILQKMTDRVKNMNTLKSIIRNGRIMIKDMIVEDYKRIESEYFTA